eukprot:SAG11_NODE_4268_length_1976_cov_1.692595_1_plen_598_part_01
MVPLDVWDWLQSRSIVAENEGERLQGGIALVDQETKLGNGLMFAKLIAFFDDGSAEHDLKSLKTARTPVGRLYNWSVLQGALSLVLHFNMDMDTKALLVAGDTGVALALLSDVVARARDKEENKRLGLGDESDADSVSTIEIQSRNGDDNVAEDGDEDASVEKHRYRHAAVATPPATPPSERYTELYGLVAASLSEGLHLKKSRAMGLAQQEGALGTLLVNGLHGQYSAVIAFVTHMGAQATHFAEAIGGEPQLVRELLGTLSAGLVSRSRQVAYESAALLAQLADAFADVDEAAVDAGWAWLTERPAAAARSGGSSPAMVPPVGLQAVLAASEIRSGMDDAVFGVLRAICRDPSRWEQLVKRHLPSRLSPTAHMHFLCTHLVALAPCAGEQALVEHAVEHATALAANASAPLSARARALTLLGSLCCKLPAAVDAQASAGRLALSALKRACRDSATQLQILAHRTMFELLDVFLARRHMLAPLLYKTLIFSLIEHHQSEFVRQFVVSNMALTIRRHQELPIGVLLEPLLRQLAMYGYNNLDFDFVLVLARHSRIELPQVLQLCEFLQRLCLCDALHARLASVPFLVLLDRFHAETKI